MNSRLWFKLIVVLAALLFMVLMGMSNKDPVIFRLMNKSAQTSAALAYFIFFGIGVIVGAILAVGPSKSGK